MQSVPCRTIFLIRIYKKPPNYIKEAALLIMINIYRNLPEKNLSMLVFSPSLDY